MNFSDRISGIIYKKRTASWRYVCALSENDYDTPPTGAVLDGCIMCPSLTSLPELLMSKSTHCCLS